MSSISRLVALSFALLGAANAAARLLSVAPATVPTRPGGYIVTLKEQAVARKSFAYAHRAVLSSFAASDAQITYEWPESNTLAGTFSDDALLALRASDDVAAIEHDTLGGAARLKTQHDAPWGLQRISQLQPLNSSDYEALTYNYTYHPSAGRGVDIYIIDSGVMVEHEDFGGRARWGKNFGGYPKVDVEGHGTHVAGTAAGTKYGVAKAARVIAVRVLDDNGVGGKRFRIAAVNWVVARARRKRRPTVINMSLHFTASDALDAAVTAAVDAGVHVVVAAGNSNLEVDYWSPGRAPAAITVGASTIDDRNAPFTNFGPLVDIFAPGTFVVSASIDSLNGTTIMSGTSMASPHVAGIVAYIIGLEGNKSPARILARIKQFSPDGILSGLSVSHLMMFFAL
ncbi:subtilisin-like protein [Auricularia subglabra TFB-10046 SS5]|nr:subtilisin-like protein [Auricularia subglabra TFB-10046 SS5]